MAHSPSVRGFFQALVTDQLISRAVEVTVGAVLGGPIGAVAVPVLSKAVEYYGQPVASRVWLWIKGQRPAEACTTLEAIANLDAQTARAIIEEVVEGTAPDAPQEAKNLTKNYLASIPATLRQTLPRASSGKSTCPAALLPRDEHDVFRLLPTFLPPYNAPCPLPGTPYQLHELVGTGGFGAVYKATSQYEHEPRALKFCLDPERTAILKREKDRLAQLVKQEEGIAWPENVVRLIGQCLDHVTPFLIFEYVPDGDMGVHVQNLRVKQGRAINPDEALALMRQLAFAVSQVHAAGLTHRDLKPSNILFAGQTIKIADFGLGAVVPRQGRTVSRQRSSAETTQEMRGAGSVLYMSKEQKRGAAAHPVQDVYSLGVIWYQLLVNDFSAELGPFWERPLAEAAVSASHSDLLKECLDDRPEKRPQSAGVLLEKMERIIQRIDEQEKAARAEAIRLQRAQEEAERQRLAKEQAERERQRHEADRKRRQEERARKQEAFWDEWSKSIGFGILTVGGVLVLGLLLGFAGGNGWFFSEWLEQFRQRENAGSLNNPIFEALRDFLLGRLSEHPVQKAVQDAALPILPLAWIGFSCYFINKYELETSGCSGGFFGTLTCCFAICLVRILVWLFTWPATQFVNHLAGPWQGAIVIGLSFGIWGIAIGLLVCLVHKGRSA